MAFDSRGLAVALSLLLAGAAVAGKHENAVVAELDGDYINLLSEEELQARPEPAPPAPVVRPVPVVAQYAPAQPARARTRRRRGGPGYRQQRVAGDTYRQKYASWSCSAASLTIAASLLERGAANETTEEHVIKKLGSNISKKDGLTGRGMDALAEVARSDFGVSASRLASVDDVTRAVQAGQVVVLNVRRPVSGSGHYVVVAGQGSKDGTLHIKDPARDGGDFEWDQKTLKSAMRAGGVALAKP